MAKKSLFTHRRPGLGLAYLPVLHSTRVLDSLHRNSGLPSFGTSTSNPLAPYGLFINAASCLGDPARSILLPINLTWAAQKTMKNAIFVVSVAGLTVYLLSTDLSLDAVYTNGSKVGDPPAGGAAAVLRNGTIVVCCVPGFPNSYTAELMGVLLRSHF